MGRQVVATNRKAFHDYHIEDRVEAGIALVGTEVKPVRAGQVNLRDGFARIERGQVLLYNVHISPYEQGNRWNHEPTRTRRLLLNRKEIGRLSGRVQQSGFTLVPLSIYFNERGYAKVELGVAKGKQLWDKRQSIAKRDVEREVRRAVKARTQ
ncbi:MAG TPA: SsrA-binding protein SmpB [Limnochordia bacterium]|nr:SsrA-binding protein SmpB [Limnochordia bacterium]